MLTKKLKFSIISLNWNGRSILGELLDKHIMSLLSTDYENFEVIFADNGSSDDSVEYVRSRYRDPRLRVVELGRNYGYAEGNNLAAEYVDHDTDIIVFINNDTIVDRNWLYHLNEAFQDEKTGVAQPLLKNFDGSIQFVGGFVDLWGRTMTISGNDPRTSHLLMKLMESNKFEPLEILWAYGACIAIRAHLFRRIGGFNPLFEYSLEELSIAVPVIQLGFKVVVVPKSIVYHKSGATISKVLNRKMYARYIANKILFIIIYFPMSIVPLSLFGRLIVELLRGVIYTEQPLVLINGLIRVLIRLPRALMLKKKVSSKISRRYLIKTPLAIDPSSYLSYALSRLLELNRRSQVKPC